MNKNMSRRQWIQMSAQGLLGAVATQATTNVLATQQKETIQLHEDILMRPIRQNDSSSPKLPVIGVGTWAQFDVPVERAAERAELVKVLQILQDKGGRVIDSSPMYGLAEEAIGEVSQKTKQPDDFFYATKVWISGEKEGVEQINSSMRKMRRSVMDLIQVHNLLDWQTQLKTLFKLKEQGKVRYVGITDYRDSAHAALWDVAKNYPIDFVQLNYSLVDRQADQQLLPALKDKGIATLINTPFASGAAFRSIRNQPLPSWSKELNITSWAQLFLKFIVSHPAVTCVIPGTSNPTHMLDNVMAGFGPMPDSSMRQKMVDLAKTL